MGGTHLTGADLQVEITSGTSVRVGEPELKLTNGWRFTIPNSDSQTQAYGKPKIALKKKKKVFLETHYK